MSAYHHHAVLYKGYLQERIDFRSSFPSDFKLLRPFLRSDQLAGVHQHKAFPQQAAIEIFACGMNQSETRANPVSALLRAAANALGYSDHHSTFS